MTSAPGWGKAGTWAPCQQSHHLGGPRMQGLVTQGLLAEPGGHGAEEGSAMGSRPRWAAKVSDSGQGRSGRASWNMST